MGIVTIPMWHLDYALSGLHGHKGLKDFPKVVTVVILTEKIFEKGIAHSGSLKKLILIF